METVHQKQNREAMEKARARTPPAPETSSIWSWPIDVWVMSNKPLDPGDGAPIPANEFVRIRDNLRLERLRHHASMDRAKLYEAPPGATPVTKRPFKFEDDDGVDRTRRAG